MRQKRGLLWVGALLFIILTASVVLIYLPMFTQRAALFGTGQVLQAGQAACSNAPAISYAATSPPANCLSTGQFLQITLVDAGNPATKLSGWSASLISMGGFGNSAPLGTVVDSCTNTAANGQCTFSAVGYPTGAAFTVWLCHSTSAPASGCYAQQKTTYQTPFPGLPGLAGGTVPFYPGTQTPTSTPTTGFFLPVLQTAGDQGATNTPYVLNGFQFNGTSIATGSTCFLNQAAGTNPCYFGSGVTKPTFFFSVVNTFVGTAPFKSGATPSPKLDIAGRGTLNMVLSLENKQVSGSDPIPVFTSGSFGTSPAATKQGSVPDVFYYTPDQSSALTNYIQAGPITVSTGNSQYSFSVDTTGMSTSGDKSSFTINLYEYFSLSYVVGSGGLFQGLNSEAVTQMTQYVITLQRP